MLRSTFIGIACVLLTTSAPAEADMCFHYKVSLGGTLVARGAKLPAANTCDSFALYEREGQPLNPATHGLEGAGTGSICQDVAGATVVFQYTYDGCLGPTSYFESGTCRLKLENGNLPTTSSTCRGTYIGGTSIGTFSNHDDAILEPCDGNDVNWQVPNDTSALCQLRSGFSHQNFEQRGIENKE
jgi:hypothetical protein